MRILTNYAQKSPTGTELHYYINLSEVAHFFLIEFVMHQCNT